MLICSVLKTVFGFYCEVFHFGFSINCTIDTSCSAFQILRSIGLEFNRDLSRAKDLDQIIEVHAGYIRKIHERCLLHKKNRFLKEAVLKVLNLALQFQKQWDCGIDNIRYAMHKIPGWITYSSAHYDV